MTKRRTPRSPAVMPIADYIKEAEKLDTMAHRFEVYHKFQHYDRDLSDRLEQQILTLRQAERTFKTEQNVSTEHQKRWKETAPKAFELRYTMIFYLKLVYHNDANIRRALLANMKKDKSISCLVTDLRILGTLWHKDYHLLKKIKIDPSLGEQALFYSENICCMQTAAQLDRMDTHYKKLRDSAYLNLKRSVDTVRLLANRIYKKGSVEHRFFTSAFYRKRNAKARATAKEKAEAIKKVEAKNNEHAKQSNKEMLGSLIPEAHIESAVTYETKAVVNGELGAPLPQHTLQERYPLRLWCGDD
ncbi:MAG: hypothetical protein OCC49_00705 [Fibrobacterales bacterium]